MPLATNLFKGVARSLKNSLWGDVFTEGATTAQKMNMARTLGAVRPEVAALYKPIDNTVYKNLLWEKGLIPKEELHSTLLNPRNSGENAYGFYHPADRTIAIPPWMVRTPSGVRHELAHAEQYQGIRKDPVTLLGDNPNNYTPMVNIPGGPATASGNYKDWSDAYMDEDMIEFFKSYLSKHSDPKYFAQNEIDAMLTETALLDKANLLHTAPQGRARAYEKVPQEVKNYYKSIAGIAGLAMPKFFGWDRGEEQNATGKR